MSDLKNLGKITAMIGAHYGEDIRTKFRELANKGEQRPGQAFMNAIPISDYQLLSHTDHDLFYYEGLDPMKFGAALDFLTQQEERK